MSRVRSENGVTYIQILLIIVTAGMVGALVVPRLTEQKREAFWQEAYQKAESIAEAQELFYATHGEFTAVRDSLLTVLPDSTMLIDPFTEEEFAWGAANRGQDYSVSGGPSYRPILITTEDRWNEFREAWQIWVDEQNRIREEDQARRGGRRVPPGPSAPQG
jgi:hypothetical protein